MPILDATEFPARAVRNLANLTASSSYFRALVGAASESAALQGTFILWPESIDRLEAGEIPEPPPRCIIGPASAGGIQVRGPGQWTDFGALFWALELVVPSAYAASPRDRLTWFQNAYGQVLREMLENMRTGSGSTKLYIHAAVPFEDGGPAPIDEDDQIPEQTDDVWRVVYAIEYGIR